METLTLSPKEIINKKGRIYQTEYKYDWMYVNISVWILGNTWNTSASDFVARTWKLKIKPQND